MTEIAIKVQHAARKWRGANEREINRIKYLSGELGSDFVRRVLRAKSRREGGNLIPLRCASPLFQPLHPPREWVRQIRRHRTLDPLPLPPRRR